MMQLLFPALLRDACAQSGMEGHHGFPRPWRVCTIPSDGRIFSCLRLFILPMTELLSSLIPELLPIICSMTEATYPSSITACPHVEDLAGSLPRWKKALFGLVLLLGLLVTAELAVRTRDWIRFGSASPSANLYLPHARLGKVPRPHAVLDGQECSIAINGAGFRGPEISVPKPPGTFRVACLGGSTTFGLYCSSNETTWPGRLQHLLRETYPDRNIEVVNAGVPGYTLSSSRVNFQERVLPLEPDAIIVYHAPNDLSYEQRIAFAPANRKNPIDGSSGILHWLARKSLLVEKVAKNVQIQMNQSASAERHDDLPDIAIDHFRERLEALVADCQDEGIPVLLATVATSMRIDQPEDVQRRGAQTALYYNQYLSLLGLNRAYRKFNDAIQDVAMNRQLSCADVFEAVLGGNIHFGDSVHFTDRGTQGVAECMHRTIISGRYLDQRDVKPTNE